MEFALKSFNLDVNGLVCADFGSSTGGFVDCLLQHGARKVYAVETGYGLLDWKLRNDGRVIVMEKTNAVYAELPEKVDLITIDTGWTKQSVILPSAHKNLKDDGWVISLVKLSFEVGRGGNELAFDVHKEPLAKRADPLDSTQADNIERILKKVTSEVIKAGFTVVDQIKSPILGAKGKNIEYLCLLKKCL